MSREREWWLRTLAVLVRPRAVFAALEGDEREELEARQEPLLAVTWLAGIAAVLATPASGQVAAEVDGLSLAIWAFLAGGIYAAVAYFALGGAVLLGVRSLGSLVSYRTARHLLGFAAVPVAVSLGVWLPKLALYGEEAVDGGHPVFAVLQAAFAVWTLALLLLGVRTLHGWSWTRSAGALGMVALVVVAFAALPFAL